MSALNDYEEFSLKLYGENVHPSHVIALRLSKNFESEQEVTGCLRTYKPAKRERYQLGRIHTLGYVAVFLAKAGIFMLMHQRIRP